MKPHTVISDRENVRINQTGAFERTDHIAWALVRLSNRYGFPIASLALAWFEYRFPVSSLTLAERSRMPDCPPGRSAGKSNRPPAQARQLGCGRAGAGSPAWGRRRPKDCRDPCRTPRAAPETRRHGTPGRTPVV